MIQLECPNCGSRNATEFRYGGEYNPRPPNPALVSSETDWADYIYMRDNKAGLQKEWWYHRAGCQLWFLGERHTVSNHVLRTYRWSAAGGNHS